MKEEAIDKTVCTDADEECRAKDPSKCWKHGEKGIYRNMISSSALQKLNSVISDLQKRGLLNKSIGKLASSVPITIESANAHAIKKMEERGITTEQAQTYINNSKVMFEQGNGSKNLFISSDGNAAVLVKGKKLLTANQADLFDEGMKILIKEIDKHG